MFVSADNNRRFAGESGGKEFIIVRIVAYLRMQCKRKSKMGFQGDHFKQIGNVDVGKMSTDILNNPAMIDDNYS